MSSYSRIYAGICTNEWSRVVVAASSAIHIANGYDATIKVCKQLGNHAIRDLLVGIDRYE
jgi:hypothetical protein